MKRQVSCSSLTIAPGIELYHTGPSLDHGPLPTLFYFALSGPDSLTLDPYNQPVLFLSDLQIRIVSLTLPAHESGLSPHSALGVWAEEMQQGKDLLDPFVDAAELAVEFLLEKRLALPDKMAAAGLSRGGLFASLLAARRADIPTVLLFAPLMRLGLSKEFKDLQEHPIAASYDVRRHASALASKRLRIYIGNRDTRVDTRACFESFDEIVQEAHRQHLRSPRLEMIIGPSIGQHGHGTSMEVFHAGAEWVANALGAS